MHPRCPTLSIFSNPGNGLPLRRLRSIFPGICLFTCCLMKDVIKQPDLHIRHTLFQRQNRPILSNTICSFSSPPMTPRSVFDDTRTVRMHQHTSCPHLSSPVTPQFVILTLDVILAARCNAIYTRCNTYAKCNNFYARCNKTYQREM